MSAFVGAGWHMRPIINRWCYLLGHRWPVFSDRDGWYACARRGCSARKQAA